jgi:hypothetical protein
VSRPRPSAPPVPGGFGFPLGFLAAILATAGAVAAGATEHPERALILLAAVTAAIGWASTFRAAIGTATVSWALHAGFVLGRHGDLAFTPQALRDSLILVTVAVLASGLASAI